MGRSIEVLNKIFKETRPSSALHWYRSLPVSFRRRAARLERRSGPDVQGQRKSLISLNSRIFFTSGLAEEDGRNDKRNTHSNDLNVLNLLEA